MGNNSNKNVARTRSNSSKVVNTNKTSTKVLKKNTKKNDKPRIAFLLFIVALFVVILISTVFSDVVQIHRNKSETQLLMDKKQELLEEEKSLNSEVFKLQDPEYKARYAREKYFLTAEGEKILTIIDGASSTKKDGEMEKENTTKKDTSQKAVEPSTTDGTN